MEKGCLGFSYAEMGAVLIYTFLAPLVFTQRTNIFQNSIKCLTTVFVICCDIY